MNGDVFTQAGGLGWYGGAPLVLDRRLEANLRLHGDFAGSW